MQPNDYLEQYEKGISPARIAFSDNISTVLNEKDAQRLLIFWINFSSLGIGMTEHVEDWIRRAGQKTEALGYKTLGKKLVKHAQHERNHHLMMIADTHSLIEIWNRRYSSPKLKAETLFKRQLKKSVIDYQKLHENCINSNFPFAQIAIEYEIENLSVVHGPTVIANAISTFGVEIKSNLTFVFDHVTIDEAHTAYNQNALSEFLNEFPEHLGTLIETGKTALEIYGRFLKDCHECLAFFETNALIA